MFTLLFGIFAFFWTALFTAVGLTVLLVFLIPLLLVGIVLRLGLLMMKLAAGVVLLALFTVCLF
jgi:hypothetical protein